MFAAYGKTGPPTTGKPISLDRLRGFQAVARAAIASVILALSSAPSHALTTWTRFIVGLLIALVIGLVAGLPLARLAWTKMGSGVRGGFAVFAILGITTLFGLTLVLFGTRDYRLLKEYRETTCVVTDRLIVPTAGRSPHRISSGESDQYYRLLLAVRLLLPEGGLSAVWGDGDQGSFTANRGNWAWEQIERYAAGGEYPCWYDPKDPHSLAMSREISWWPYLTALLALGLLNLLGTTFNKRSG